MSSFQESVTYLFFCPNRFGKLLFPSGSQTFSPGSNEVAKRALEMHFTHRGITNRVQVKFLAASTLYTLSSLPKWQQLQSWLSRSRAPHCSSLGSKHEPHLSLGLPNLIYHHPFLPRPHLAETTPYGATTATSRAFALTGSQKKIGKGWWGEIQIKKAKKKKSQRKIYNGRKHRERGSLVIVFSEMQVKTTMRGPGWLSRWSSCLTTSWSRVQAPQWV